MKRNVGARVTAVAVLALFTVFASARGLRAQGLLLTGYADFQADVTNIGSGNSDFFFDNHHFNLIGVGQLTENIFANAEIEYEHSGDEINLEYGYIGYTGIKNLKILAGKFIVPFGRFNKDLHPTWINKMVDRPHGFKNILPQTYSDVGLWVSGGAPVGMDGAHITYDAFVVNGLMGPNGGDIRGFRGVDREKRAGGRDDNKAVGGRLGLELPPEGFDIGGSIYFGNYSDDPAEKLDLLLLGADAAFRKNGLEIRGEVVTAQQDTAEAGGHLTKTGGYVQAAYLVTRNFEPVIRFSGREMPGSAMDNSRVAFGFTFYPSAGSAVRLDYLINDGADNDGIAAIFSTSL